MTWAALFSAAAPSVVVGVFLALFNRAQRRRDERTEQRAAARRRESLLSLDLAMTTAKLAYATAAALKRGHTNGEVDEGIRAYSAAKKLYVDFLNEQASEHLLH